MTGDPTQPSRSVFARPGETEAEHEARTKDLYDETMATMAAERRRKSAESAARRRRHKEMLKRHGLGRGDRPGDVSGVPRTEVE